MDVITYALLKNKIMEYTYDDTEIRQKLLKVIEDVNVINGNGEGSINKTIADEIAKIVADAPDNFNTLKELSDWINVHSESAADMNSRIVQNTNDIAKKFNKNQGSENSGKVAGINESGEVIPMFMPGVTYNEESQCLEYNADEKLNLSAGIQLDDTLTKSGYAADAAATGKAVEELKGDIAHIVAYNLPKVIVKDNYGMLNYKFTQDNNYFMILVPVDGSALAYFNIHAFNDQLAFMSDENTYINRYSGAMPPNIARIDNSKLKIARNNGIKYIGLTFAKSDTSPSDIDITIMSKYKDKISDDLYQNFSSKSDNILRLDKWYYGQSYGTNEFRYNTVCKSSGLIEVDSSKKYFTDIISNDDYHGTWSMFDDECNYLGSKNRPDTNAVLGMTFVENTKYVSLCWYPEYIPNGFDETNFLSTVNYYEQEYKRPLALPIVNPDNLAGVSKFLTVLPENTSYYYRDKKFCFEGDSLTAAGSGQIYALATCMYLGITKYKNTAVGGSSMEGTATGEKGCMVCDERVNKIPLDTDYIVIMCGTNGSGVNGELSLDNHDITTFIGAYNVWMSKIYYKFRLSEGYYSEIDYSGITRVDEGITRDIRIVLITPPHGFGFDSSGIPEKILNRGNAILEMSRRWGVPCLDSMKCMYWNAFNWNVIHGGEDTHFGKRTHFNLACGLIGLLKSIEPIDFDTNITATSLIHDIN